MGCNASMSHKARLQCPKDYKVELWQEKSSQRLVVRIEDILSVGCGDLGYH